MVCWLFRSTEQFDQFPKLKKKSPKIGFESRGGGTGEASEALASPEFRGFTTEKFLASWIYERGNFSCFTGKKLVPRPLDRQSGELQKYFEISAFSSCEQGNPEQVNSKLFEFFPSGFLQ